MALSRAWAVRTFLVLWRRALVPSASHGHGPRPTVQLPSAPRQPDHEEQTREPERPRRHRPARPDPPRSYQRRHDRPLHRVHHGAVGVVQFVNVTDPRFVVGVPLREAARARAESCPVRQHWGCPASAITGTTRLV
jgi:hypothetical protein